MSVNIRIHRTGGYAATAESLRATDRFRPPFVRDSVWLPSQVGQLYRREFTLAAAATLLVDLLGGTSERDVLRDPLSLADVRWLFVQLASPAPAARLVVGPSSAANTWVGPFGSSAGSVEVRDTFDWSAPGGGIAVSSGASLLRIHNPSAASVTATLLLAGLRT
jgi:hypothetical protein